LEKNSAGLMDGTEDGLASITELAEEGDNRPGTLRRS
jgi:alpha-acetolactate decarboxylase